MAAVVATRRTTGRVTTRQGATEEDMVHTAAMVRRT